MRGGGPGKGYEPRSVPCNPNGSRWWLSETPKGWTTDPATNAAQCFADVARATAGAVPRFERPSVTLRVMWAEAAGVRQRGAVTLPQVRESLRPGKIGKAGKAGLSGGPLLDSLALGGEAFELATDHECYAALAEYAAEVGLSGQPLRTWNDALACLLAARAGVELSANADVFRLAGGS